MKIIKDIFIKLFSYIEKKEEISNKISFNALAEQEQSTAVVQDDNFSASAPVQVAQIAEVSPSVTDIMATIVAPEPSAIPLDEATKVVSHQIDSNGQVRLPQGSTLNAINVHNGNLLIEQADGTVHVIARGASHMPSIAVGDVIVPREIVAKIFSVVLQLPMDENGNPIEIPTSTQYVSSGSNFMLPLGDIGDVFGLTDLLDVMGLIELAPPEYDEDPTLVLFDAPVVNFIPTINYLSTAPSPFGGNIVVEEAALLDGSDPASPAETTTGELAIDTGNESLSALVINNIDVTNGGNVSGQYGTLAITHLGGNEYTWIYTLTDNADHPDTTSTMVPDGIAENFEAVVTDQTGDMASDVLTIDIADDGPVAIEANDGGSQGGPEPIIIADHHVRVDEDDLPTGNADGDAVTSSATGSVAHLIAFGADKPGSFSLLDDTSGLPTLMSGGEAVQYSVDGMTLTGTTGSGPVFTFELQPDGVFSFTLLDQIDHPGGTGDDNETLSVDFSHVIIAADSDGDQVALAQEVLVLIENDVPVNNSVLPIVLTVHEDALAGGNGEGGQTAIQTLTRPQLQSVLDVGADDSATFSLNLDTSGLMALGLASGGQALSYAVSTDGLSLSASTTAGPVFTFVDDGAGNFTFTLLAPLDHTPLGVGGGDGETLSFDLSSALIATDFDGDSIVLQTGVTIVVENDVPVRSASATPFAISVEESGLNAALGSDGFNGLSDLVAGNADDAADTAGTSDMASGSAGSLTSLFSSGADAPLAITIGADTSGLPTLYAGGEAVSYSVSGDGTTLTAFTTSGTVFTFTVNTDGSWEFDLDGRLDHVEGGGENTALLTAADGSSSVSGIDLSSVIRARDFDGDTVAVLNSNDFVITIDDDVPVNNSVMPIVLTVHEDALAGGNGEGGQTAIQTLTRPQLQSVLDVGADDSATFSLNLDTSGLMALGLASGGQALSYAVSTDGLSLSASTTAGPVFTFVDDGAGNFTFTLLAPLDHTPLGVGGGDGETLSFDLSSALIATDFDGDSIVLQTGVTIVVENDVPVRSASATPFAISVEESGLNAALGSDGFNGLSDLVAGNADDAADTAGTSDMASGSAGSLTSLFSSGADAPLAMTIGADTSGLPTLYAGGEAVSYSVSGDGTTLTAFTTSGTVFTFTVNTDGSWEFDLDGRLDHVEGGGENTALLTAADGSSSVSGIDLSSVIRARDFDGDTVAVLNSNDFVITIDDDVPVNNSVMPIVLTVHEDALVGGNGEGGQTAIQTLTRPQLQSVLDVGADDSATFSLNLDTSGLMALGLASGGQALSYAVSTDGLSLSASTTAGPVFTFVDDGAGNFTFTLLAPLDHTPLGVGGGDGETLSFDLSSALIATDFDGDSMVLQTGVTIVVENDVPVRSTSATPFAISVEESGLNAALGSDGFNGLSDLVAGNADDAADTAGTSDMASGSAGSLTSLFSSGADAPLAITIGADTSGLPTLYAGGEAVSYSVSGDGTTLTAFTTSGTVFTFTVNTDGSWEFDLDGRLDHVEGGGENTALLTAADGSSSVSGIDLSSVIRARDFDGDTVAVLNASDFVITIDDDVPVNNSVLPIVLTVHEDALVGGNGEGGQTAIQTLTRPQLQSVLDVGADDSATFSLNLDTSGLMALGLASGGQALSYAVSTDGLSLSASTTAGPVFTFVDDGAGNFTFTLLAPLDHTPLGVGGGDGETLSFDLSSALVATDFDGDSIVLQTGVTIVVENDVPVRSASATPFAISVEESGLNAALGSDGFNGLSDLVAGNADDAADTAGTSDMASGSAGSLTSLFSSGADAPLAITIGADTSGLPTLYAGGEAVSYSVSGDGTTLTAFTTSGTVFTFTVNTDGSWAFDLDGRLDHVEGGGENTALLTAADGSSSVSGIDLSSVIRARDFDGDTVAVLNASDFVITIDDDVPVNNSVMPIVLTVHEDALAGGNGEGGQTAIQTLTRPQLQSVLEVGADDSATFSLNLDTSGLMALGLASGGQALSYAVSTDGLSLSASTTAGPVFTFVDDGAGNFTFTLLAPLDHTPLGVGGGDGETLSFDLSSALIATDFDGDSIVLQTGVTIVVENDVPVRSASATPFAISVEESGLNAALGSDGFNGLSDLVAGNADDAADTAGTSDMASGSAGSLTSLFSSGADAPLAMTIGADTSGLPTLYAGGEAVSYSVSGDGTTLTAFTTSGTVFTFTVNTDGSWEFDLDGRLDHVEGGGENTALLTAADGSSSVSGIDLSSVIRARDFDGDTVAVLNASDFVITIDDDVPSPEIILINSDLAVDESVGADDGLVNLAIPGDEVGQSDPFGINATIIGYAMIAAGLVATLTTNAGADEPAASSVTLTNSTGEEINNVDSGLMHTETGNSIILNTTVDGVVVGQDSGTNSVVFAVGFEPDGDLALVQYGAVSHANSTEPDEGTALGDIIFVSVTVTDDDGDAVVATTATALNITFEDDGPSVFITETAVLLHEASASFTGALDTDMNIDNNGGSDLFSNLRFAPSLDGADSGLTADGLPIIYSLSGDGLMLTGSTTSGTIFTAALNLDGDVLSANDTYTFTLLAATDGGAATVDFSGSGYDFVGGNDPWAGFVPAGQGYGDTPVDDDSLDLLLTPMINGVDDGTINSNANSGGVSIGASVGANETLRIDFVSDLTGNPGSTGPGDYDTLSKRDHVFDEHYAMNGASATFTATSGTSLAIAAFNDPDGDNVVGDGVRVSVSAVAIGFAGATEFIDLGAVTTPYVTTIGGQIFTVTTSLVGGETVVGVDGILGDKANATTIAIYGTSQYNSLEFSYVSGDDFKIGGFGGTAIDPGTPVEVPLDLVMTDGDGDEVSGTIDVILLPPEAVTTVDLSAGASGEMYTLVNDEQHVIGSDFSDTLTGNAGDNILFGGDGADVLDGAAGEDTLIGGYGSDSLTGGADADTFVLDQLDIADVIVDYDNAEGDIIDLSQLLNGLTGVSDLESSGYVRTANVAGDDVLQVDADGGGDNYQTVALMNTIANETLTVMFDDGTDTPKQDII